RGNSTCAFDPCWCEGLGEEGLRWLVRRKTTPKATGRTHSPASPDFQERGFELPSRYQPDRSGASRQLPIAAPETSSFRGAVHATDWPAFALCHRANSNIHGGRL